MNICFVATDSKQLFLIRIVTRRAYAVELSCKITLHLITVRSACNGYGDVLFVGTINITLHEKVNAQSYVALCHCVLPQI